MIVAGIAAVVVGLSLLALQGSLVPRLRKVSAQGYGPQPSPAGAKVIFVIVALALIAIGASALVLA